MNSAWAGALPSVIARREGARVEKPNGIGVRRSYLAVLHDDAVLQHGLVEGPDAGPGDDAVGDRWRRLRPAGQGAEALHALHRLRVDDRPRRGPGKHRASDGLRGHWRPQPCLRLLERVLMVLLLVRQLLLRLLQLPLAALAQHPVAHLQIFLPEGGIQLPQLVDFVEQVLSGGAATDGVGGAHSLHRAPATAIERQSCFGTPSGGGRGAPSAVTSGHLALPLPRQRRRHGLGLGRLRRLAAAAAQDHGPHVARAPHLRAAGWQLRRLGGVPRRANGGGEVAAEVPGHGGDLRAEPLNGRGALGAGVGDSHRRVCPAVEVMLLVPELEDGLDALGGGLLRRPELRVAVAQRTAEGGGPRGLLLQLALQGVHLRLEHLDVLLEGAEPAVSLLGLRRRRGFDAAATLR
mmetsp:Transcript_32152/g.93943  ORF Transcript_32152/g.93943 Transcript_32152/m.93943 type:complete len:406 (-) Transcript_32152:102-1319(-)